jgi:hypothetical protein
VITKRVRMAAIGAVSFILVCGFALVCCTRPTTPTIDATPPRGDTGNMREAQPLLAPWNDSTERQRDASVPDDVSESAPPGIDMDTPEGPEPRTPRYLEIVEQVDAHHEAKVQAAITPPTRLELETDNIKRLRITRQGLPLAEGRSIVLRIDGQGIEWTRQYLAVELERSSAGIWTVVGRRPYAEP